MLIKRFPVKKVKRQATDWKKRFVLHLLNKGLISKIYFKIPTS